MRQPQNLLTTPAPRIIGLALFALGIDLMLTGRVTLRKNYSSILIIRENHYLVTYGIYRFTRNPIYLGLLLVVASLPIYARSLAGFLAMLSSSQISLSGSY